MTPLAEVAAVFLRLGCTAFGGPAVHIAMMERELVAKRAWVTADELLDLIGACNLIPGPNSTELALHLGHRRAGWAGLVVAGLCFILPAALITAAFAHAYVTYGTRPDVARYLLAFKVLILYVVAQAVYRLSRTALKTGRHVAIGVLAAALIAAGANELSTLFGCGLAALTGLPRRAPAGSPGVAPMLAPILAAPVLVAVSPGALFAYFFKIGSILYGSGYVLIAFLRADLVLKYGWLTDAQLIDLVALGQITPGPVFTTATAVGWVLAGPAGAALATAGIFLPAFLFVALSGWLVPRLRASAAAGAFLDGVNVGSLVLMAWATGASVVRSLH